MSRRTAITLKQDLETLSLSGVEPVLGNVYEYLGIKTEAGKRFIHLALTNAMLMDRKQSDYGSKNISKHGTFGVIVRLSDKMERLSTLFNKGKRRRAVNESIQDTFRDISNYAIIALMLENGMWPNE